MPIDFRCPNCGHQTLVADQFAGHSGPCAKCGATITVPGAGGAGFSPAAPAKKGSVWPWVLGIGAVLLLCCGGGGGGLGYLGYSLYETAQTRVQTQNRLHELMVCMHNYHDMYGALPAHASYSADGKPLLSWRVHLLPLLGRDDLYRQFRLDEPWDSAHNRALIDQMPAEYKLPGVELASGKTCFVVPTSSNPNVQTAFPKPRHPGEYNQTGRGTMGLAHIHDGTSNTIGLLRVPDELAVTWTKPDDFDIDSGDPEALFGERTELLCVFLDTSYRRISQTVDRASLRNLFLANDGNAVSAYDY
jgi:hypothetical protein